jgi:hypothetical protein
VVVVKVLFLMLFIFIIGTPINFYEIYLNRYTQERGSAYSIPKSESQIQTEIMTNGPVEADYDVYSDFLTYKSEQLDY